MPARAAASSRACSAESSSTDATSMQPVSMGFWHHDRRDIRAVRPDRTCEVVSGQLYCAASPSSPTATGRGSCRRTSRGKPAPRALEERSERPAARALGRPAKPGRRRSTPCRRDSRSGPSSPGACARGARRPRARAAGAHSARCGALQRHQVCEQRLGGLVQHGDGLDGRCAVMLGGTLGTTSAISCLARSERRPASLPNMPTRRMGRSSRNL